VLILTFETTNVSCEIGLNFPIFVHESIATCIHNKNYKFIVNKMSIESNTLVILNSFVTRLNEVMLQIYLIYTIWT